MAMAALASCMTPMLTALSARGAAREHAHDGRVRRAVVAERLERADEVQRERGEAHGEERQARAEEPEALRDRGQVQVVDRAVLVSMSAA